MKAPDIVAIVQVAGPLLIELVELLLRYWREPDEEDRIVDLALATVGQVDFVDEHGVRFRWQDRGQDATQAEVVAFIRGLIAAKRMVS